MSENAPSRRSIIYIAKRINDRPQVMRAFIENNTLTKLHTLSPSWSLRIRNHSPDGFEWGYPGSGPAQLALAILLDYTQSRKIAELLYQRFKHSHIAPADKDGWQIDGEQIEAFLGEHKDLVAALE